MTRTIPKPKHFPFPHEILMMIFSHLTHDDLVSLSLLDRRFRECLRPYIFQSVKLDWSFVLRKFPSLLQRPRKRGAEGDIKTQEVVFTKEDAVTKFVERIHVVDANIQNEWNFKFDLFVCEFTNLTHLTLNTKGSSNFLKYNGQMPLVLSLELITRQDDVGTGTGTADTAIFNLNHCKPFTSLKKLTINGFVLDFDDEDVEGLNIKVKELELVNCSWNYPFQLKSFGEEITTLSLTYNSHQFILSERFREFLHNPNLPQLQYLTISNQNWLKLHITFKIMNFLKNIPALKRLYLLGNIYNETITNFTTHDMENTIRYIMNVNNVKIFYSSFVDV